MNIKIPTYKKNEIFKTFSYTHILQVINPSPISQYELITNKIYTIL